MTLAFDLYYEDVLVAHVCDCFCTDNTWYGKYACSIPAGGRLESRLLAFIAFAEDWNARWNSNPDNPPDPAEFDQFADVMRPGVWQLRTTSGVAQRLDDAPTLLGDKELSWRTL